MYDILKAKREIERLFALYKSDILELHYRAFKEQQLTNRSCWNKKAYIYYVYMFLKITKEQLILEGKTEEEADLLINSVGFDCIFRFISKVEPPKEVLSCAIEFARYICQRIPIIPDDYLFEFERSGAEATKYTDYLGGATGYAVNSLKNSIAAPFAVNSIDYPSYITSSSVPGTYTVINAVVAVNTSASNREVRLTLKQVGSNMFIVFIIKQGGAPVFLFKPFGLIPSTSHTLNIAPAGEIQTIDIQSDMLSEVGVLLDLAWAVTSSAVDWILIDRDTVTNAVKATVSENTSTTARSKVITLTQAAPSTKTIALTINQAGAPVPSYVFLFSDNGNIAISSNVAWDYASDTWVTVTSTKNSLLQEFIASVVPATVLSNTIDTSFGYIHALLKTATTSAVSTHVIKLKQTGSNSIIEWTLVQGGKPVFYINETGHPTTKTIAATPEGDILTCDIYSYGILPDNINTQWCNWIMDGTSTRPSWIILDGSGVDIMKFTVAANDTGVSREWDCILTQEFTGNSITIKVTQDKILTSVFEWNHVSNAARYGTAYTSPTTIDAGYQATRAGIGNILELDYISHNGAGVFSPIEMNGGTLGNSYFTTLVSDGKIEVKVLGNQLTTDFAASLGLKQTATGKIVFFTEQIPKAAYVFVWGSSASGDTLTEITVTIGTTLYVYSKDQDKIMSFSFVADASRPSWITSAVVVDNSYIDVDTTPNDTGFAREYTMTLKQQDSNKLIYLTLKQD
jgi:hypothetical protein